MRVSKLRSLAAVVSAVVAGLMGWMVLGKRDGAAPSVPTAEATHRGEEKAAGEDVRSTSRRPRASDGRWQLAARLRDLWAARASDGREGGSPEPTLTWQELSGRFDLPDDKLRLPRRVREWIDEAPNDATGATHVRLARVAAYCDDAPQSAEQLDSEMERASRATRLGEAGRAAAQARIQDVEQRFAACSALVDVLPDIDPNELLTTAALRGNQAAAVELATSVAPTGVEDWSAEELGRHRRNMGDVLEGARASCEPSAFEAFATATGRGKFWEPSDTATPQNIERYANRLALGLYQAQRTKDAHELGVLRDNFHELQLLKWTQRMTPEEVDAADAYGRALYQRYCRQS